MAEILLLSAIHTDGGTQSRASINDVTVADYAADMERGEVFPPVVVFHDGKHYWLADGFHRVLAARLNKWTEIPADIRQGTRRDAVLFSVGANAQHGLRRTNEDKRRAVETLLSDKEWRGWSDNAIAKQCGVDHKTVAVRRAELYPPDLGISQVDNDSEGTEPPPPPSHIRRGADGRTINTAKIGRSNGHARVGSASDTSEGTDPPSPDDTIPEVGGKGADIRDRLRAQGIPVVRVVAHRDSTFTAGFEPTENAQNNATVALMRGTDMQLMGWDVITHRDGCVADNDQTGRPIVVFRERTPDSPGITERQREVLRAVHLNLGKRSDGFLSQSYIDRRDLWLVQQMPQGLLEFKREGGRATPVLLYRLTPTAYNILGINPPSLPADSDAATSATTTATYQEEDEDEVGTAEIRGVVTSTPAAPTARQNAVAVFTSSASYEHYTPEPYITAAREVMGRIDLDPASCEIANRTVQASVYFTAAQDGLKQSWDVTGDGDTATYMNSPWGKVEGRSLAGIWINRAIEAYRSGEIKQLVINVKAATAEKWFAPLWDGHICFVDHRISYDTPTGPSDNTLPGSSVFVYFGHQSERFIEVFTQFGPVVPFVERARRIEEDARVAAV